MITMVSAWATEVVLGQSAGACPFGLPATGTLAGVAVH